MVANERDKTHHEEVAKLSRCEVISNGFHEDITLASARSAQLLLPHTLLWRQVWFACRLLAALHMLRSQFMTVNRPVAKIISRATTGCSGQVNGKIRFLKVFRILNRFAVRHFADVFSAS